MSSLVLLSMTGWTLFSNETMGPDVAAQFLEGLRSWGLSGRSLEAIEVGSADWSAPAGLMFGVASCPELWFTLLTSVPVFTIAVAYRMRGLTSPLRNQEADAERRALAHAELGLMVLCLFGVCVWLFGTMLLGMQEFGVVEVGDPRVFLALAFLGVGGAYLGEVRRGQAGELRSQLIGFGCGLLGLLFLLGPSLGWTVRSIFAPFQ